MSKPIHELLPKSTESFKRRVSNDLTTASQVFKLLHGYYGQLFLSRFTTGVIDEGGHDKGVSSAIAVWAFELRGFSESLLVQAIDKCKSEHKQYPPNLPEFVAICKSLKPSTIFRPTNALEMSGELRSAYARRAREIIEKHAQRAIDRKTGYVEVPKGINGLKQAIANAVATAGGDEVGELVRLDRMFERDANVSA